MMLKINRNILTGAVVDVEATITNMASIITLVDMVALTDRATVATAAAVMLWLL
jgi:hypothetical protein